MNLLSIQAPNYSGEILVRNFAPRLQGLKLPFFEYFVTLLVGSAANEFLRQAIRGMPVAQGMVHYDLSAQIHFSGLNMSLAISGH